MELAVLRGQSGTIYHFQIFSVDEELENVGGVYALTKRVRSGEGEDFHRIYFFGHSPKLADTTSKHRKIPRVARFDCDCVFMHVEESEKRRMEKFEDIRRNYNLEEEIPEKELE